MRARHNGSGEARWFALALLLAAAAAVSAGQSASLFSEAEANFKSRAPTSFTANWSFEITMAGFDLSGGPAQEEKRAQAYRDRGLSEEVIQQKLEAIREESEFTKQGRSDRGTLRTERDGGLIRAVRTLSGTRFGNGEWEEKNSVVEESAKDGVMVTTGAWSPERKDSSEVAKSDAAPNFPFSIGTRYAQEIFFGHPWSGILTPKDIAQANREVIHFRKNLRGVELTARVRVRDGALIEIAERSQGGTFRITAETWEGGLPTKVRLTQTAHGGQVRSERAFRRLSLTPQPAASAQVKAGSHVMDKRLGKGKLVRYVSDGTLKSEPELVEALKSESAMVRVQGLPAKAAQAPAPFSTPLIAAVVAVVIGAFVLILKPWKPKTGR